MAGDTGENTSRARRPSSPNTCLDPDENRLDDPRNDPWIRVKTSVQFHVVSMHYQIRSVAGFIDNFVQCMACDNLRLRDGRTLRDLTLFGLKKKGVYLAYLGER